MVRGEDGGTEEAAFKGSEGRGRGKESVGQLNGREKGRAQILGQEFYPGDRKPFHLEISACSYPTVLPKQEVALARWCQGL